MSSQPSTASRMERGDTEPGTGIDAALLRGGVALVLLLHSLARFGIGPYDPMPVSGFAGFLGSMGVPAPGLTAWVVTLVELVGGVLILVGLFTRAAAALAAVVMLVALALVHLPQGLAADGTAIERTLLMALASLALVVRGAGPLSIEEGVLGYERSAGARLVANLT
ncbi:DoxX family protein [Halomicrobium salinisoli]|uniref:DoxX family protein n=1 Tax=Halomicrobium salinisoli TaxID=2878391 RepID=UPI001CF0D449|nr:DoxX family protein [Halomicrobium salinisoli]